MMIWELQLFLAKHFGFYRYGGLMDFYKGPKGQVLYPDGNLSYPMALGMAVDYAEIFGGKVMRPCAKIKTVGENHEN